MRQSLLLLILTLFTPLFAGGELVFSPINSNHGLSDNGVRTINQLADGRMVFVTPGLVNLYDGARFKYMRYDEQEAYPLRDFYGWHISYVENDTRLWLKNQHKLLLFDIRKEMAVSNIDSIFRLFGITQPINDLFMDASCNLWLVTSEHQLWFADTKEQSTRLFLENISQGIAPGDLLYNVTVAGNDLFLFYRSGRMICYDLSTQRENYRDNPFQTEPNIYTSTLAVVAHGRYLYQARNGFNKGLLLRFDLKTHVWEKLLATDCWQNTLTLDSLGNCWVSTFEGLWHIDGTTGNRQLTSPIPLVDGKGFETEITSQFHDGAGGLWLGSINRGLLYFHPDRFTFRQKGRSHFPIPDDEKLRVTCFSEWDNQLLIGTQNGLFQYDRTTGKLQRSAFLTADIHCNALFTDRQQQTWLCTQDSGLYRIDTKSTTRFKEPRSCQAICEAPDGKLYLSTSQGFGVFNPDSGTYLISGGRLGYRMGYTFQIMPFGTDTLIGIFSGGLFLYDCRTGQLSSPYESGHPAFRHKNRQYHCLFTDSRGLVWFGTQDGLNVFHPQTQKLHCFYTDQGLVNNAIRSITEDGAGRIWISTSNGISLLTLTSNQHDYSYAISNFNRFDGVIENEFIARSVLNTSYHSIVWGGIDGFNEIDLTRFGRAGSPNGTPLFTDFYLFGTHVSIGKRYQDNLILPQSVSSIRKITLKHTQNFFGIDFSALNYSNPTQTTYRFILEGIDENWNEVRSPSGVGHANYTNVAPGNYLFKVVAVNHPENAENPLPPIAQLQIVIAPPIWATPFANFVYIILFVSILYLALHYYTRYNQRKMAEKQKEELEQMKMAFYTNLSHEFRTPLTLVMTPLSSLMKRYREEPLHSQLKGIFRHANDLLQLVNQLLDLRKWEMKGETVRMQYCQIEQFLASLVESFEESAAEKGIHLSFTAPGEEIFGYTDKEKVQKIVYNLLSNALKFTPQEGEVQVSVEKSAESFNEEPMIRITVSDTGCGMAENELANIFTRFYQVQEASHIGGSGIGLHLVQQYAHLLGGKVSVVSKPSQGSCFTIELPYRQSASPLSVVHEDHDPISCEKRQRANANITLLVVEDNPAFRKFLRTELSVHFQVSTASNGLEGLQMAREKQPDVVVTDLMMPEMSGTRLCYEIKNDLRVSHIPVIMLTAKTSDESQMEGFQAGADAYITKPFNMELLLLRIHNLIDQQQQRKNRFKEEILPDPRSFTLTDVDASLIETALAHIHRNLDNPDYSVQQFSRDMMMDRTGLYRKLMALTGQTPSGFLRTVRLKHAAHLLAQGLPVSEVAERVGFGTPHYFSKCFQEMFGIKPSQYRKNDLMQ